MINVLGKRTGDLVEAFENMNKRKKVISTCANDFKPTHI